MFKKILVPLDGSEVATKILPEVTDLAKACEAELTLIHVCYGPSGAIGEATPGVMERAQEQETKWCSTYLAKTASDLRTRGLKVNFACIEGVPAREIIAYADKNKMDLIAMATHGRSEVAWVLGSTAEKVVSHATKPVLLFRVTEIKPPSLKEEFFTTPGPAPG